MSIIVLACDTKNEKCSNRIRWEKSLNKQKLNYLRMDLVCYTTSTNCIVIIFY